MNRVRVLALIAAAALLLVPVAAAKVWFLSVRGKEFRAGSLVTTEIAGCRVPCPPRGTRVSLAPGRHSVRAVRYLAAVDRAGKLRFRVPDVAPGPYHLVARGRVVSDVFRIVPAE